MSKIVDELILVFSLKILFGKLSTFRGYKGIYSRIREECEKTFFYKTGHSSDSVTRVG